MENKDDSASPLDIPVRPDAWMHDEPNRFEVIHDASKELWMKAFPKQVEHYTVPLFRHAERQPLSTESACALLKSVGADPILDGNMLKILRAVEVAHGIRINGECSGAKRPAGTPG